MLKVSRRDSRGWLGSLIGGRGLWLALFTIFLVVSSVVPVLAESPPGQVVVASEEEAEKLPRAADIAEGLSEVKELEVKEQQLREASQAEEEREISVDAYAGLTAAQAETILQEQFAEQLALIDQDPARALSDARLDRVLGPNAALVTVGGDTMLVEGTIPVRATDEDGDLAKVNLDLAQDAEGYVPENPITEVTLPADASEPVSLGDEGFAIAPILTEPASPARSLDGEDIQYFETQKDSDLIVSPLAAGVELFSLLRSAESPEELRFEITLPAGAELRADGEGGAEVVREGERLIRIPPPVAFDAQGADVPVAMRVEGSSLVLAVEHRGGDLAYPLLVDPQAVQENWYDNSNDWYHYGNLWALEPGTTPWVWGTNNGSRFWAGTSPISSAPGLSNRGLFISATSLGSSQPANQYGQFTLTAPGGDSYFSAALINPFWRWDQSCGYQSYPEPHDYSGLWSDTWGWATFHSNWARVYGYGIEAPFDQLKGTPDEWRAGTGHVLVIGMGTGNGAGKIPCWRDIYAGGVNLWMDDWSQPILTASPNLQWMDNVPVRLDVSATDAGLGVRKFEAEATDKSGITRKWETWHSCTGGFKAKCPQTWNLGDGSQPKLAYDPSVLPEGVNTLNVTAYDAVLRKSNVTKQMAIRIDHGLPTVTLSGTVTEQATLGTERPKYTIRADANDGVPGSEKPEDARAGVAAIVFKNDGQVIGEKNQSCPTQSCAAFHELEVPASKMTAGSHTLSITATDTLGHISQPVQLNYTTGDKQAPALNTTGLPSESSSTPMGATYWSAFGTAGAGDGQFNRPADVAVGSDGEIWVSDKNNSRIQKFDAEGKYQFKFGTKGSGNGQLSAPTGLALDAQGNLWVADSGNHRVQKFNPQGEYLAKFGSQGTGNGQFSSGGPRGIAIDGDGNIWVSDYSTRVQKFNANGEFLKVVGEGQLGESASLDVGGGKVWVGDWANNRISVFSEAGEYLFKVGSAGSGNGQFSHPDAVEVDAKGNVWVGDEGNNRVQQFNQVGEYIAQFGSNGSGNGQFKFAWPFDLAADDKGSIWIADSNNHRVQRWVAPTTTVSGYLEPIAGTATDGGFGVTSVAVELTDKSLNADVLDEATQTCPQGACQLSLNADEVDLSERPVGPYILSVVAKDAAGNVRETSRVFNLDPTPPAITLSGALADSAGAPLATASAELEIAASDLDAGSDGIRTINVERNGQLVASYPSDCSSDCNEVEASYTFQAKEDGAERSIQSAASSAEGSVGELKRVSCVAAEDCWAVGRTKYTLAEQVEGKVSAPLLERWDGEEWQAATVPKPEGATNVFLEGISCNSASACLAVGYYGSGSSNYPLAERWDGTKWTASSPSLPNGATKGYLYGVSCSSASNCWAYGKTQATIVEQAEGKVATPYLVRWDGSAWQAEAAPKPEGATNVFLEGISCNSASACLAVGYYGSGSSNYPLAERWDGTKWTASSPSLPNGATKGYLYGVSCSSASNCWAYGKTQATIVEQAEGKKATFYFVRWDGNTWQAAAVPKTPSGSEATLTAIACPSGSACTAVGRYINGYSETLPLAYTWNGSEWRFQPVPTPAEATAASLEGVSCTNANECAMVGYSQIGSGKWTVLTQAEVPGQGPHQIMVEAVDTQGNSASETIEIDISANSGELAECDPEVALVSPKGVIGTGQAINVLEEDLPSAVAPSEVAIETITEEAIDPSYAPPSPDLEAVDSLVESETSVTPNGGFTLADTVCFTPTTLTTAATTATVANGDAAVFANTAPETDTLIRPTAMGTMIVQSLRGLEAPDSFSWTVTVAPGEKLIELPSGSVAIIDPTTDASEGDVELPTAPAQSLNDLADVETQIAKSDYQIAKASNETPYEVVAVIAQPWIVLASGGIVPAIIEIVEGEIPNEFELVVHQSDMEEEGEELIIEATASKARNGHCLPGESPCGRFDAHKAAGYAKYWGNWAANGRNENYPDYDANNCTNFMSQVIRKGGMQYIRAYDEVDGAWWYQCDGPKCGMWWNTFRHTPTWSVADMYARHLWRYGLVHIDPVNQPWGWTIGNILAYDWLDNGKGNFDHLQYVVGTVEPQNGSREPLMANHSSPAYRYGSKRWTFVKKSIEEGHEGDWARVPLAVKHTHANWKEKKHAPQNLYGPNGVFQG